MALAKEGKGSRNLVGQFLCLLSPGVAIVMSSGMKSNSLQNLDLHLLPSKRKET